MGIKSLDGARALKRVAIEGFIARFSKAISQLKTAAQKISEAKSAHLRGGDGK